MPFDGSVKTYEAAKPSLMAWLKSLWEPSKIVQPVQPVQPLPDSIKILQTARGLISDPKHWIQRRYETFDGRRCAVGALRKASRMVVQDKQPGERINDSLMKAHEALNLACKRKGFSDVEKLNDHSSHSSVLQLFDEVIESEKKALHLV